jgi:hypothetical protein
MLQVFFSKIENVPHMVDFYYSWGQLIEDVSFRGKVSIRIEGLVRKQLIQLYDRGYLQVDNAGLARQYGITQEEIDPLKDFESGSYSLKEISTLCLVRQPSSAKL